VHNSYFFLKQVGAALDTRLRGYTLVACFSQSKDELLLEFNNGTASFFLKASILPELQVLSFPPQVNRARKNSVDLFGELVMKKIAGVRALKNDRSLLLEAEGGYGLLFKMHGNQSNVLLMANDASVSIFRKNLEQDIGVAVSSLEREVDWSEDGFHKAPDLHRHYFTFGSEVWAYLEEQNFSQLTPDKKWKLVTELLARLDRPETYFHLEHRSRLLFSLLPFGTTMDKFHDPLEAVTAFVPAFTSRLALDRERSKLTGRLTEAIRKAQHYLAKTETQLREIAGDKHFQVWADVLMANLDKVKEGESSVRLDNFYDDSRPVNIKLNPRLSPQRNAETYYRKSKNRALEIERLERLLQEKRTLLGKLDTELAAVAKASTVREVRNLSTETGNERAPQSVKVPYREVVVNGFRVWIGKDARSNDELTFKLGFKEDLWLHAKDVSGSHVLIRYQAGKDFPRDVVDRAAQLAAWFSKRKTDTLCPVAVTPKKFVRKRKGEPAGTVVVEKEKVMLVEPKGIESVDS